MAMNWQALLSEAKGLIDAERGRWQALSKDIWEHPELAYEERYACKRQVDELRSLGFDPETPTAGVETAFRADVGSSNPAFAIASEYDALEGIGHGCGHNLICTAALAAFHAAVKLQDKYGLKGRLALLGTPAEESGGGKVVMLEHGCLDGIDAAMMVHPSWRTTPDTGSTADRRFDVTFHGKAAHAAGSPELGLNALDAMLLLFTAINAWRQQLPEFTRVHGVILEGGVRPNIIPDRSRARFYLRSAQEDWAEKMEARFWDIIRGAELMTGCTAEVQPYHRPYMSRKPNAIMNSAYVESMKALGANPVLPPRPGRGSSDFGNFSQVVPGIHPYFAVGDHEIPGHSLEMAEASASDYALDSALRAAAAMAVIAVRYLGDDDFRNQINEDFRK
ncbi:MAG TPA: M20 family metallopeptidase [Lentisphaeria bacterium]|nr:M20 family metallopeptidase [Lentisphaeria bacterium]